ncbi:MAG: zinc-ribbon domain-containing protein [Actinomycetota bacterium]|nr:zinc-ribbon domain-containing protein [Actinomycetota bacterium]
MIVYCPRCGTPFREEVKGDWFESSVRCTECALTVAEPPLMLARGNDEDEVDYDLGEWQVGERSAATAALLEADIPYRWEENLVLAVPAVAEDEVDLLLDELEDVEELEEDDDGPDGGAAAQEAMGELFVAADRLQHDPTDDRMAADLLMAAGTVSVSAPPYGIERPTWRQIQSLAATLATDLEEATDEDTVAADARALREYLRDLV